MRVSGADQVVDADGARASGQQALVGPAFIVIVEQLYPKHDLAVLDGVLQMRGMSRDQPMAEGSFQRLRSLVSRPARRSAMGPGRATDQLGVRAKRRSRQENRPSTVTLRVAAASTRCSPR